MKYRFSLFDNVYDTDPELLYLHSMYAEFDTRIEAFSRNFNIRCAYGCGECCKKHEPEITSLEALYVAHWIMSIRPDLSSLLLSIESRRQCVFFQEANPLHCLVYPARPLMCRAFGYSATEDKVGNPAYRTCRYMNETKELHGDALPSMTRPGRELLYRRRDTETLPVSEAVTGAWQKLQLHLRYSNTEEVMTESRIECIVTGEQNTEN